MENRFAYFSEQPTFDTDGYVIDPVTMKNMKDMVQEVVTANQIQQGNLIPLNEGLSA